MEKVINCPAVSCSRAHRTRKWWPRRRRTPKQVHQMDLSASRRSRWRSPREGTAALVCLFAIAAMSISAEPVQPPQAADSGPPDQRSGESNQGRARLPGRATAIEQGHAVSMFLAGDAVQFFATRRSTTWPDSAPESFANISTSS